MHANLLLLKQRAQRAVEAQGAVFEELLEQARSPGEKALVQRLREAGGIIQEQERVS